MPRDEATQLPSSGIALQLLQLRLWGWRNTSEVINVEIPLDSYGVVKLRQCVCVLGVSFTCVVEQFFGSCVKRCSRWKKNERMEECGDVKILSILSLKHAYCGLVM